MLIDWFTVGAQVLNFIILVWLMKRFLYGPIQAAIAAREARIADELAGAERQRIEASAALSAQAARSATFDSERHGLMATARADAQAESVRLLAAARVAADALAAQRRERLAAEADELSATVRRRALDGAFSIARKTLGDLASTSLEASACDVFVARLSALGEAERASFSGALSGAGGIGVVRTAFELPEPQRAAVMRAVDEAFATRSALAFETAPALVCGIELAAGARKISWSVADELSALQREVVGLLQAGSAAPVESA